MLNDYELAEYLALHGTENERRLAKALLELHDELQYRPPATECPECGAFPWLT